MTEKTLDLAEIEKRHAYAVDGGMDHDGPELMDLFKAAHFDRAALIAEVRRLRNLISDIKGALDTEEDGDNLVDVASDSHAAELEHAAAIRSRASSHE